MKQWILLQDGVELKRSNFPDDYTWVGRDVAEGLEWLEIVQLDRPEYDQETSRLERAQGKNNGRWEISYNVVPLSQEALDAIANEKVRVATLHAWHNQYILMARSLGLPDKATTQEIQAKLSADKATLVANDDLAGALDVVEKACAFLAIINAISQSGGNHAGIEWHEAVSS